MLMKAKRAYLSRDCVTTRREKLRDACSVESSFSETKSSSQTRTSCASIEAFSACTERETLVYLHDDSIVLVLNQRVFSRRPRLACTSNKSRDAEKEGIYSLEPPVP